MTVREQLIEILRKPIFPHELADPTEAVADYLLDNGVTIQRWIPVTERLPKEKDADVTGCVLAIERSDGFARRWEMDAVQRSPEYFTHWMPPAPGSREGGCVMTGFNTQVGGGEYRLQFETDNREHYELMQKTARQCVGTGKPLTNADRIRAMSNGVLAQSIMTVSNGYAPWCNHHCEHLGEDECCDCIRNWLRQPVQPRKEDAE